MGTAKSSTDSTEVVAEQASPESTSRDPASHTPATTTSRLVEVKAEVGADEPGEANPRDRFAPDRGTQQSRELQENLERLRGCARALREFSEELSSGSTVADQAGSPVPPASEESGDAFSRLQGKGLLETALNFGLQLAREPQTFVRHYASFAGELLNAVRGQSQLRPARGDRRFRDAVWQDNPVYRLTLQTYLAWDRECRALIDDLRYTNPVDWERTHFIFEQMSAALAPSNLPLNPVVVKRAYQTGGKSLLDGLRNFGEDLRSNHGMPRQITPDAYRVGEDLGRGPGAVVYRDETLELIQYDCQQNLVHKRPVLVVPPQINKFYIFDLSPKNSMVDHLRRSGLQVFMVSWRNPDRAQSHWGLDSYLGALDQAVQATLDISGSEDLNLVSACAGGFTAVCLQALYANQGRSPVRNHSVLVTALSMRDHSLLKLFLNRNNVLAALARSRRRGVMEGKELAHVFAWLRPTDLVWNYWVNNNLLGKEPPPMDVLFWDNDSTRLPAALHRDFVDLVVNDRLANNTARAMGQSLDLRRIEGDFYFLGGDEDYLMPWKSCYLNPAMFSNANCRFVLSNSGHIQSVLRPPGIASSRYYVNEGAHPAKAVDSADAWFAGAEKRKGSWWEDWTEWFSSRSGSVKKAPREQGNQHYPVLCPSPGTYVLEK